MRYEYIVDEDGQLRVLGPVENWRWGLLPPDETEQGLAELRTILGYGALMDSAHARRFELHRDEDATGISGTGIVAEGVEFRDGVVCLRWLTEWPSSVVHYERGMESVEAIHGHNGRTRIVMLDD